MCIFNSNNNQKVYRCPTHGRKIKIYTQTFVKNTEDLIMIDFSQRSKDGNYKLVERLMVNTGSKCGSEIIQYSYCGHCGVLLGKPEDPERKWKEFKKIFTDV